MQTILKFQRDLSRTTLAPPLLVQRLAMGPDFAWLKRELRLQRDTATGELVIRESDRLGAEDAGDHAEQRFTLEMDARRAFKKLAGRYLADRAWRRLP